MSLNLNDRSYHKLDVSIQYISKESNHPNNLIKHLPASAKKRLSNYSSDEKVVKKSVSYYEDTLSKTGSINKLVYHTLSVGNHGSSNKNYQPNIIWFNPPYCLNVTTITR